MKLIIILTLCALLLSISACCGSDLAACQAKADADGLSGNVRIVNGECQIELQTFTGQASEWRRVP